MKASADDTAPDKESGAGWDENLLVWNATVAIVPATSVRPDSADDAASIEGGKATPGRGPTVRAPRPLPQAAELRQARGRGDASD